MGKNKAGCAKGQKIKGFKNDVKNTQAWLVCFFEAMLVSHFSSAFRKGAAAAFSQNEVDYTQGQGQEKGEARSHD